MPAAEADFVEEDFYRADGVAVADGYGNKVFDCDDPAQARQLACVLNIAFARGVMKGFSVLCPPGALAEVAPDEHTLQTLHETHHLHASPRGL